jgi:hypothetical protein
MQERNPNHPASGPLGIRISLWFMICGLLLTCALLITISSRLASPSAVETASSGEDAARRDLPPTPRSVRPIYRVPPPETVSESDTQSASPRASAAISNELSIAREKLTDLRGNYADEHPDVEEQIRAIESLERSALTPDETLELAKARADLARLRVHYGDGHPDVQSQLKKVAELQR